MATTPDIAAAPLESRGPIPRWPAVLLLAHLALLIILKSSRGIEGELLWISHVSLAITAAGFLLRSTQLLAIAFVAIAALHTTWMFDFIVGMTTGSFPVGMAMYLPRADAWTWLATSHHAYLTPLLALALWGRSVPVMRTFVAAVLLFTYLAIVSRLVIDPVYNVNRAHHVFLQWDHHFARNANALPAIRFLPGLIAVVATLFFAPSAIALRLVTRKGSDPYTINKSARSNKPIAGA